MSETETENVVEGCLEEELEMDLRRLNVSVMSLRFLCFSGNLNLMQSSNTLWADVVKTTHYINYNCLINFIIWYHRTRKKNKKRREN